MAHAVELAFVLAAEALKREPRRGWARIGVRAPESVADHSWRLALLAMVYADLLGLDAGKAARIALLHDLPEARTGDTMPGEWSPRQKHARESRALRGLLRPLPARLRARYLAMWMDYEAGRSAEARLVGELDKLEMVAQALSYERARGAPRGAFDRFWGTAERSVHSAALRERLAALRAMRPQGSPTARRASPSSRSGSRGRRKRYSRSPRAR